ncbi:MAG: hypothetical protein AB8E82_13720 [Aureispira sp.]
MQQILDFFIDLLSTLIPDYDVTSISDRYSFPNSVVGLNAAYAQQVDFRKADFFKKIKPKKTDSGYPFYWLYALSARFEIK